MFDNTSHRSDSRGSSTRLFIAGLMLASGCAVGDEGDPAEPQVAQVAQASTISYTPSQDTWARRVGGVVGDWGTSRELRTNNIDVAVSPETILVRFPIDLAAVCPTLSSAELSLHSAQLFGPLRVYVHPITGPWTPGTTGMLSPAGDCSAFSGDPAVFVHPQFLAPSVVTLVNDNCTRFKWDVTAIVQAWCNNPGTNRGFLLAGRGPNGPDEPNTEVNFFSMEAGIDRRPTLDITY
jgi:hypothetical protein